MDLCELECICNHKKHKKLKPPEEIKCDVCDKTFTTKDYLKIHSLIHVGIKPHVCNICDKSFTHKGGLRNHYLRHEGSKPHVCNVCDKSFTLKGDLKRHSVTHEGLEPYVCNICNKSFSQKGNLKKHILIHEGVKPYICNICNTSFTHESNLKRHSLIHKGIKPHECNICNKSFTQKVVLNRHLLMHERKKVPKSSKKRNKNAKETVKGDDSIVVSIKEELDLPSEEDKDEFGLNSSRMDELKDDSSVYTDEDESLEHESSPDEKVYAEVSIPLEMKEEPIFSPTEEVNEKQDACFVMNGIL